MIQPLRSRASARTRSISLGDVADAARHEQLVVRAEVGAPVDLGVRVDARERAARVEHDDDVVGLRRKALRQPAPRRDLHGAGDAVERDPVARRQRRDRADPRHDVELERDVPARRDVVEHRDRAVVERGIAPDEKRAARAVGEVVADVALPDVRAPAPPVLDGLDVGVRRAIALRVAHRDDPLRAARDVARDDLPPRAVASSARAPGLSMTKRTSAPVSALHRRDRDVVGVAGADPDDRDAPHAGYRRGV